MTKKKMTILFIFVFLIVGCSIATGIYCGFKLSDNYAQTTALKELIDEGYANTTDATATAQDVLEGKIGYVNGERIVGTYKPIDTSNANAKESTILQGKIAIVDDEIIEGSIPSLKQYELVAKTYGLSTDQNVYLSQDLIIKGDPNLIPENIKKGITIFGVTGTYEPIGGESNEEQ